MMTSLSQNLNIKARHGGFDVRAGGDEKQKINFAWPNTGFLHRGGILVCGSMRPESSLVPSPLHARATKGLSDLGNHAHPACPSRMHDAYKVQGVINN